jgi:hypothetical protein
MIAGGEPAMSEIVLTEEQARLATQSRGTVRVCDREGKTLGVFTRLALSDEEIAELRRRAASPGPWYTGDQVKARLRALEQEWEHTGGFDTEYARKLLERLNAADPGHMRPPD